jgi:DNA-binding LacI/PurR family transcriptional regulator
MADRSTGSRRKTGDVSSRPTIRDVARAASVSLTTVSDVVNGKGRVDPDTRARVLQTVAKLGYRPQRAARALRSGRTGTIALCTSRTPGEKKAGLMDNDYDMELTLACAAAAMDSDLLLLLAPKPRDLMDLGRLDVDGVIVVEPPQADPTLSVLEAAGMAVVTVQRDMARSDNWWVGEDNRSTAFLLLNHLAGRGAGSIALFSHELPFAWFADMHRAFSDWCAHQRVAPVIKILDAKAPQASAAETLLAMVDAGEQPDAVLTLPYNSALGVLDAAKQRGITVPGDLLVAAGVDSHALELAQPSITSVDLRPGEVGRAAVELLKRRIAGEQVTEPVLLDTALRQRASS